MSTAHKMAIEIARLNDIDLTKVRPALDTHTEQFSPCWVILEAPDRAEVVYEDDPDTVLSARNRPGRFVTAA